jgi:purine-nucleoside phosphorylase
VLGFGLGDFAEGFSDPMVTPYSAIPHWPASHVIGHAGKLVGGTIHGRHVIALSGRVHMYEGHSLQTATFAMRVMGALGVPRVILTNAAGGITEKCSRAPSW